MDAGEEFKRRERRLVMYLPLSIGPVLMIALFGFSPIVITAVAVGLLAAGALILRGLILQKHRVIAPQLLWTGIAIGFWMPILMNGIQLHESLFVLLALAFIIALGWIMVWQTKQLAKGLD